MPDEDISARLAASTDRVIAAIGALGARARRDACEARHFDVVRVQTEGGSHIEPPLDQGWSDLDKLGWCASVVSLDADLPPIRVLDHGTNLQVASMTAYGFRDAWSILNGIELGARLARRHDGSRS